MGESPVNTLNWRTSRRSATNGECVEVASASGRIVVRDSKHRDGVILRYNVLGWRRFIQQAKSGNYKIGNLEP
jgi:Domain of unknown function (DUF397)